MRSKYSGYFGTCIVATYATVPWSGVPDSFLPSDRVEGQAAADQYFSQALGTSGLFLGISKDTIDTRETISFFHKVKVGGRGRGWCSFVSKQVF